MELLHQPTVEAACDFMEKDDEKGWLTKSFVGDDTESEESKKKIAVAVFLVVKTFVPPTRKKGRGTKREGFVKTIMKAFDVTDSFVRKPIYMVDLMAEAPALMESLRGDDTGSKQSALPQPDGALSSIGNGNDGAGMDNNENNGNAGGSGGTLGSEDDFIELQHVREVVAALGFDNIDELKENAHGKATAAAADEIKLIWKSLAKFGFTARTADELQQEFNGLELEITDLKQENTRLEEELASFKQEETDNTAAGVAAAPPAHALVFRNVLDQKQRAENHVAQLQQSNNRNQDYIQQLHTQYTAKLEERDEEIKRLEGKQSTLEAQVLHLKNARPIPPCLCLDSDDEE